ncbi:gp53-like domain-containing protein [Burkholderia ubonensis]|uniref:Putative tail fiber protein gp53-like C-terminal domain-containing protein n=1 Tax=Burkholderia ubonensis TaxID=101571 RepID=A0ABD4DU25_9BURK|nr:hypothetical protein [Burkholderia ubonensis]KVN74461.1 hypothetical protein WJ68_28100 [Burkholderia ubonensis]KVU56593.1 hypothetical protein WK69_30010 [Burkholderia ubonensis]KVX98230.1 hypothetical protein WL10_32510 [Burkholderia ubonensis]KVZ62426.1 hypothetical protein WL19_28885 [Burkholderia ubonensis]
MTDLVESSTWTPGIRQFETSDPVEGGPDGIDNVPLRQLANRTRYLKDVQDAQAGGLEMKAPLASPAFTGSPQAPVPQQFDNTSKIATTAFVQRALGNFNASSGTGSGIIAAAVTLTNDDVGGFHYFNGPTNQTATLPSEVGLPPGAAIAFQRGAQYSLTIGTNKANAIIDTTIGLASSITLATGEFVVLVWSGTYWQAFGTYTQRVGQPFANSLTSSGYQKLPSGLIIQWGSVPNIPAGGSVTVNYPIAFPNSLLSISAIAGATSTGSSAINGLMAGASSNPKALFVAWNGSSNLTTQMGAYISLGY